MFSVPPMDARGPRHHVLIAGTGRSGSSFLVELLTNLGVNKGFKGLQAQGPRGSHSLTEDCPYVVEHPDFHEDVKEIFQRDDLAIDHIFIPIRDLSRQPKSFHGQSPMESLLNDLGRLLWETDQFGSPEEAHQKACMLLKTKSEKVEFVNSSKDQVLAKVHPFAKQDHFQERLYQFLLATSNSDIPVTFMHFPRIIQDSRYLYAKLQPILPGITYEFFRFTFTGTVRADLLTTYGDHDHREGSEPVFTHQAA